MEHFIRKTWVNRFIWLKGGNWLLGETNICAKDAQMLIMKGLLQMTPIMWFRRKGLMTTSWDLSYVWVLYTAHLNRTPSYSLLHALRVERCAVQTYLLVDGYLLDCCHSISMSAYLSSFIPTCLVVWCLDHYICHVCWCDMPMPASVVPKYRPCRLV